MKKLKLYMLVDCPHCKKSNIKENSLFIYNPKIYKINCLYCKENFFVEAYAEAKINIIQISKHDLEKE